MSVVCVILQKLLRIINEKTKQSMYIGLYKHIPSKDFLLNLALIYDLLYKLSLSSEALHSRNSAIV